MTFYRVNNDWCFYIHNYLQSTNKIMPLLSQKPINDEPIMMIGKNVIHEEVKSNYWNLVIMNQSYTISLPNFSPIYHDIIRFFIYFRCLLWCFLVWKKIRLGESRYVLFIWHHYWVFWFNSRWSLIDAFRYKWQRHFKTFFET